MTRNFKKQRDQFKNLLILDLLHFGVKSALDLMSHATLQLLLPSKTDSAIRPFLSQVMCRVNLLRDCIQRRAFARSWAEATSNRSKSITLVHAAAKSFLNFSSLSDWA